MVYATGPMPFDSDPIFMVQHLISGIQTPGVMVYATDTICPVTLTQFSWFSDC